MSIIDKSDQLLIINAERQFISPTLITDDSAAISATDTIGRLLGELINNNIPLGEAIRQVSPTNLKEKAINSITADPSLATKLSEMIRSDIPSDLSTVDAIKNMEAQEFQRLIAELADKVDAQLGVQEPFVAQVYSGIIQKLDESFQTNNQGSAYIIADIAFREVMSAGGNIANLYETASVIWDGFVDELSKHIDDNGNFVGNGTLGIENAVRKFLNNTLGANNLPPIPNTAARNTRSTEVMENVEPQVQIRYNENGEIDFFPQKGLKYLMK